ncbi:MAG TPA: hypothetical protein VMW75_03720 [Thermoanaerobaculia bacterium]|nr:hypothetical protein [Thermoanaerobaculia bacterium]
MAFIGLLAGPPRNVFLLLGRAVAASREISRQGGLPDLACAEQPDDRELLDQTGQGSEMTSPF